MKIKFWLEVGEFVTDFVMNQITADSKELKFLMWKKGEKIEEEKNSSEINYNFWLLFLVKSFIGKKIEYYN
jgi:hypothetical protein